MLYPTELPGLLIGILKHKAGQEPGFVFDLVERKGIEPSTFALRTRRSPS